MPSTGNIDMTARCNTCPGNIEHYAGIPGSAHMTPYWRHIEGNGTHPAVPRDDTIVVVAEESR